MRISCAKIGRAFFNWWQCLYEQFPLIFCRLDAATRARFTPPNFVEERGLLTPKRDREDEYNAARLSPWSRGRNIRHRGALIVDM